MAAAVEISPSFRQGPPLPEGANLARVAGERGIEFFMVSFVDIFGVLRSKMVPAEAITQIQADGAGFAPFAAHLDHGPDAADLIAIPDPTSLIQVPFQPELAFVFGDCYIRGERVRDYPRWVLKDQIEKAGALGLEFKTGVEAEFFLLAPEGPPRVADGLDRQEKACYDVQALMRRYTLLRDIIKSLNACGYGVYQADHEDANGQFEINWRYADCLTTADRHVFFKWVVKTLAERHGLRATFMPRPFEHLTGSGCHCHCSLWSGERNIFVPEPGSAPTAAAGGRPPEGVQSLGLSAAALHFVAGVLAKTRAVCALTNPAVNSYKRLSGAATSSGSTWAPNCITLSGNNRTHLVRVPEGNRFEVRVPDGAVNPYVLQATLLAAGLRGLQLRLDPSEYYFAPEVNMYEHAGVVRGSRLPGNLWEALEALDQDPDVRTMLGPDFIASFLKLKRKEWSEFMRHVSTWELDRTLDC